MVVDGVPLHPALTHVPLGLAVVLPIVTAAVLFAVWSGKLGRRPILLVVVLQATVVASGWYAMETGEHEAERVASFVPEAALASHAEWGERFVIASAVTLALSLAALFVPWRGTSRGALAATVVTGALAAWLGIHAGHDGGELVYRHQAARAYAPAAQERAPSPGPAPPVALAPP